MNGVRAAYAAEPGAWATGAELVYRPLAAALVGASPIQLAGRTVLDVGAGTGAVSAALVAAGARPVAVDLTAEMLAHGAAGRPPAAAGDVLALPFRGGAVGAAVAAFVLNHLTAPEQALRELHRVVAPGGAVLAAVFSNDDRPPLKDGIDAVARRFGWTAPGWYVELKDRAAPLLGTVGAMAATAVSAGLAEVEAVERTVDPHLSPEEVVRYRLSLAHLAPFVAGLAPEAQRALWEEAVALAHATPEPYAPAIVILSARSAQRSS
jgi:ubiquinone/menaquinone biosynthesis C-methylase UbiE